MHELSIAMSIVEIAGEELSRRGDARAEAVHVRVGELSGVVSEALRSAWDLACEGTAVQGARLEIEEVPVVAHCSACRAERPVVSIQEIRCRTCGTPTPEIVGGQEIEISAMEIQE